MQVKTKSIFYKVVLDDGREVGVRINEFEMCIMPVAKVEEVPYVEFKKLTPIKEVVAA
jgi:hypothetical protein